MNVIEMYFYRSGSHSRVVLRYFIFDMHSFLISNCIVGSVILCISIVFQVCMYFIAVPIGLLVMNGI